MPSKYPVLPPNEVAKGTLKSILGQAGITLEEFLNS